MRNRKQHNCTYMGSDKLHCACGFSQNTIDTLFKATISRAYTPSDLKSLALIIQESSK